MVNYYKYHVAFFLCIRTVERRACFCSSSAVIGHLIFTVKVALRTSGQVGIQRND